MKHIILSIILLFMLQVSWAQNSTITGVVTDENGETLPGVNVILKGTTNGTISDINGQYALTVNGESATLVFSFIGYLTKEIPVGGQTTINVQMDADVYNIQEVVAIGYGVQKKSDVTGSLSSVKGEELESQSTANVEGLLQGRAAGVQVTSTSGSPGSGVSLRVRGTGTVNNSEPLYVVDGILLGGISDLNPNDIKSIEVLKDASATAIYGSRGANGVVLITTKTGMASKSSVTVESMVGIQQAWKKPDLLNSEEWYDVVNISRTNGGLEPLSLSAPANDLNHTSDWFDEVTQNAMVTNSNISVSTGNERSQYRVSSSYYTQEGIVKGSAYDRLTFRINSDTKINDKINFGTRLNAANAKRKIVPSDYYYGIINVAQKLDPITPIMDEDENYVSSPYTDVTNPVAYINREIYNTTYLTFTGNAFVQAEILKGLKFKSSFSLDLGRGNTHQFGPEYFMAPDEKRDQSTVTKGFSFANYWLSENTLNYDLNLNKTNFNFLAGYTVERSYSEWITAVAGNTPGNNEELQYIDAATNTGDVYNNAVETKMYSYLGRINVSHDNRYFLTGTVRYDGSSVFGPGQRFGIFPSVSLGWKLFNESFMDFLPDNIFTDAKIRGGWGQVGNANISPYGFTSTIATTAEWSYSHNYVFGDQVVPGAAPRTLANKNIHWESVESINAGLDLALFEHRINFTFDYFIKKTNDMLIRVPLPIYAGYGSNPYKNAGNVENKGYEITLEFRNQFTKDFSASLALNASHITNEVVSLGEGEPFSGGSFRAFSTTRTEEGHPIGAFYGYVVEGVFQDQSQVDAGNQPTAVPGDFIFKDINNDGEITSEDRTFIGNPHPDWYFGVNLSAQYKGFDFTAFFQGVYGVDLFNAQKWYTMAPNTTTAKSREILNYWYPGSGINDMYGLNATSTNNNIRESTFYIEDGSYLRLKNLQVGYTFNKVPFVQSIRLFFSGQNLITLTKYTGLDPEIGGSSTNTGLDYGTYPQARVYNMGLSIKF